MIVSVPVMRRYCARNGFSLLRPQKLIGSNEELLALCRERNKLVGDSTVHMRVRIVSLTSESLRVIHHPIEPWKLFKSASTSEEVKRVESDEAMHDDPPSYGVIQVKLAGMETPL